jgi:methionine-rich copper-binding protein CopC
MICSLTPSGDLCLDENKLMKWSRNIYLMLLLTGAAVAHAYAHAFVDHTEPAVGSKVKQMPNDVRVWFTEPIEPTSSSIKVFDATGKQIDKKDVHGDTKNKAVLQVSLPSLTPGSYKVVWRVVSLDTHATNGDFTFQFLR